MPLKDAARPLSRGYQREDRVEEQISALLNMTPSERARRLTAAVDGGEEPAPECVVYFVRERAESGDAESAWAFAEQLAHRMTRRISRRLAVWKSLTSYHREEVEEALMERLYRAWLSREPANEFWEVRFNLSLDRALADEIDKVQRRVSHEQTLSPVGEDGLDPWDAIQDRKGTSPEDAAIVAAALASLQEPLRTAFFLKHRLEWTEEEIAARMACTSRTVRNYLRRADDRLAMWREMET